MMAVANSCGSGYGVKSQKVGNSLASSWASTLTFHVNCIEPLWNCVYIYMI
jgi:hypothetical protein